MKRRMISMALSLLMILTAFAATSCGDEVDPNTLELGDDATAMTLTIYGIKEKGTTDEAIALVQEAMSSITEAQFNTAIRLMLYTEAEYDKVLEAKMDEIQAQLDREAEELAAKKAAEKEAKKNNTAVTTAVESTEEVTSELADETIVNEYGLIETKYPEVEDTQLDIFLMTDYEMLKKYNKKGVLTPLDEQISSTSKLLKSYIHPTFLTAGKAGGKQTVAIPNNQPIGEYTFLLLNKSLMDKYYYDADDIKTFNDCKDFIIDVGSNDSSTYKPFMGDISPVNLKYYSLDGSKSVIASMPDPSAVKGEDVQPKNIIANANYREYMKVYTLLKSNNWIGADTIKAGDKFGVGIIKGTKADVEAFENDYYINVLQNPQATTDNVYNGMFAVSKYTKSVPRAMEIITYLNTKADLRNIFAYGVEGVHWELDKDGVVKTLSKDYKMKLEYTGNEFLLYPPEGTTPDVWDIAMAQNLDSVMSPFFGFDLDFSEYGADEELPVDLDLFGPVKTFSENWFKTVESQTYDTIESFLDEQWSAIDSNEDITALISVENDNPKTLGKYYAKVAG